MRNFFSNLGRKFQSFMQGRYGNDEFSHFLSIVSLVMMIIALIIRPLRILYYLAIAILIYSLYRSFSKNIYRRQKERNFYLKVTSSVKREFRLMKDRWKDRNTYRYYKCPHCKAIVRISKPGRGKTITITCGKCQRKFDKKISF